MTPSPGKTSQKAVARDEVRAVENSLKLMRERLVAALPAHVPVQSFIATVLTACTVEPKLLLCERHSLFLSCMKAARDGLLPDGREAALVPFRDTKSGTTVATYIPMYQGLLKKVRNSGELASLSANVVYATDEFEYELGDNERIVHRPNMKGKRGEAIACYAIARTKDGAVYRRVLNREDIADIKAASRGVDKGPWSGAFESEMWVKSVIRRLSKILPQSTDITRYLENGPRLPAEVALAQLPDGDDPMQTAEFELRTRAMAALRDVEGGVEALKTIWTGVVAEYKQIGAEIPNEVEDIYHMRFEALSQPSTA